jgi:hypothetical protein
VPLQEVLQQPATKAWVHFERPGLLQQLAGFEQQLWAAGSQLTLKRNELPATDFYLRSNIFLSYFQYYFLLRV